MQINRIHVTAGVLTIMGLGLLYSVLVAGSEQIPETVYVDSATGEAFVLPSRSPIEDHPNTGEPTLTPGLYCEKCQAWKPIGSTDNLQARRLIPRCPIHKIPLSRDGPLPE